MAEETVKDVTKILARKENEVAELKKKLLLMKEQESVMTPAHKMAIVLHKRLCHHDHTEGCDWYYDIKNGVHDWNSRHYGSHAEYLQKAEKVIAAGFTLSDITKLLDIV